MRSQWVVLCFLVLLYSWPAAAQIDRASITGMITDSSGAVIPGVQVIATNTETKVATSSQTDQYGLYRVVNLPIGPYTVTFTKVGFRSFERTDITLTIAQVARVDATLQVGAVAQSVEVHARTPLLETEDSVVGTNMQSRAITNLPLN